MAEDDSILNRDTDEPDLQDVWARLHQKVAVNDAYYHFIDTGKLMPLMEACQQGVPVGELHRLLHPQ